MKSFIEAIMLKILQSEINVSTNKYYYIIHVYLNMSTWVLK